MADITETALNLSKQMSQKLGSLSPSEAAGAAMVSIKEVVDEFKDHFSEVQKLRDFFDGNQITGTGLNSNVVYVPQWPDETEDELETRTGRMKDILWNRTGDGILTHVDALYTVGHGRVVQRNIDWTKAESGGINEKGRKVVEEWYERFLPENEFTTFAWNVWAMIGSEKWALVMLRWMDMGERRLGPFPADADRSRHQEDGVIKLDLLDNLLTIPLPHPDFPDELGAVIRWWLDPDASPITSALQVPRPGDPDTITELVTDTLWLRFKGNEIQDHAWNGENRYGDVRRVFVWGRNPLNRADSEDGLQAQTMLNEALYTGWEVRRQHGFPETLYSGYEPPMRENAAGQKVLARGPNVAHIAEDPQAKIIKASPDVSMTDIGVAESRIHQMLDDAFGISPMDRSDTSGLGQMRSAPAIARIQAKSERRRRRKVLFADLWERDLFRSAMESAVYHMFGAGMVKRFRNVTLDVVFPDDAFVLDPFTESQRDAIDVQAGLATREEKVRKRHPDASDEEIEEMLKQIEAQEQSGDPAKPDPTPQDRSAAQDGSA